MTGLLPLVVVLIVSGCTAVKVTPVETAGRPLPRLCIERNPKVIVQDFLPVVQTAFLRHGVQTVVYDPPLPADECPFVMTYTAWRGWDMAPYLKHAELTVSERGTTIGTATYHHGGWFGLNKFAGTASKMTPVVDELLARLPPAS